jgi:hypothetical protein
MAHKHILLKLNDGINDKAPAVVAEVKILQTVLKDWGELDANDIDGQFGNQTDKAVKDFQGKKSLTPDGVVGKNTWAALLKVNPSEVEIISRPDGGGSGHGNSPFSGNKGTVHIELKSHGFSSNVQIAAIMGSIRQEAGPDFDPHAKEQGPPREGLGLFQWSFDRKKNMPKITNDISADIHNQIVFFVHELDTTEKIAAKTLRNATTLDQALHGMQQFERFDPAQGGPRRQFAEAILTVLESHS